MHARSPVPIGSTFGRMSDQLGFLADRREIDDLLVRYATVLDTRRWDELETVFTPDAVLDYRSAGGIRGSLAEVGEWLATVLPFFTWTQHLVVNRAVRLTAGADDATVALVVLQPERSRGRRQAVAVRRRGCVPRPPRSHPRGLAHRAPGRGDAVVGQSHAGPPGDTPSAS